MRPALQLAIATPLAALLAAGGCGGAASNSDSAKKFSGTEQDVAQVVEDFQKASEKNDGKKICRDLITPRLQVQIARANRATANGCTQAMDDGLDETDQADLTVTAVHLAGATAATAVVKQKTADKKSRTTTVKLQKVAGRWRIDQLAS